MTHGDFVHRTDQNLTFDQAMIEFLSALSHLDLHITALSTQGCLTINTMRDINPRHTELISVLFIEQGTYSCR